ncbi:uncharacterized protein LOC129221096 [Uloborus diversus]|uniref:uncharacterized protein LOC129221096 n=1 Tax=Uloborus diversus TaxID=327109 RepID=UPI002409F9D0|nr:uncharacterized protein LOC129221096 [Uloborus diversus]
MGVSTFRRVAIFVVVVLGTFVLSQDYPTYSELDLPRTRFSCKNKINGGYYADIETDCQMYHVCSRDKDGVMRSTRFLCGNGTVFDQRQLVCQDYRRVQRCKESRKYYRNVGTVLVGVQPRLRSERRHQEVIDEDYPTYSELDLPETSFSCEDKVNGGYYADIETKCQMYHICSRDKVGVMRSTRFLCGNGTVFDQQHLVCQDYRRVPKCKDSRKYYRNVATILELLEERLRSEKGVKAIMDEATFDSQRFK